MALKINKYLLLLFIVVAAFVYRFSLMVVNSFPPGADIGLHQSLITSITSGKTDFFWNNYHMGGGLSVTNPGYHIFTAFIISMTGAPDYLSHAIAASFFSTFTVLSAFLLVRRVWGELAGFAVAFLVVFSAGDIVMLAWSGYPNIVTLVLIPIVFFLYLEPSKYSQTAYFITSSVLISAIFLTHVFSAFVFIGITLLALLASLFFSNKLNQPRKQVLNWLMPIFFGVFLVLPYLANILPVYFGPQSSITGTVSVMKQAVLETRLIPLETVFLSLIPFFMFFFVSKSHKGRFFTVPAVLCAAWIIVPAVMTQSYLFGVYLDYERFVYFFFLPMIICTGLVVVNVPKAFTWISSRLKSSRKEKLRELSNIHFPKRASTYVLLAGLLISLFFVPLFVLPDKVRGHADFFQVMDSAQYEAIQWINNNTPVGAVLVADAEFGWWLSGFGKRPTLSAVDPQYLILEHEFEPARVASNLLKADYLIDNGLIEVKQVGVYSSGNIYEILAVLNNSYVRPPVFSLNNQISMLYRNSGVTHQLILSSFASPETQAKSNLDNASFLVTRENALLRVTEEITIYRGTNFAEISFLLEDKSGVVQFDWLRVPFQSRGFPMEFANSIGIVDNTYHELNQLIFPEAKLGTNVTMQENADFYELIYNLQGKSRVKVSFFVGLCQFETDFEVQQVDYLNSLMENNTQSYLTKKTDLPLNYFDYQAAIRKWNISYVAIRDFQSLPRFSEDPMFDLAFKNSKVAIFKVTSS